MGSAHSMGTYRTSLVGTALGGYGIPTHMVQDGSGNCLRDNPRSDFFTYDGPSVDQAPGWFFEITYTTGLVGGTGEIQSVFLQYPAFSGGVPPVILGLFGNAGDSLFSNEIYMSSNGVISTIGPVSGVYFSGSLITLRIEIDVPAKQSRFYVNGALKHAFDDTAFYATSGPPVFASIGALISVSTASSAPTGTIETLLTQFKLGQLAAVPPPSPPFWGNYNRCFEVDS